MSRYIVRAKKKKVEDLDSETVINTTETDIEIDKTDKHRPKMTKEKRKIIEKKRAKKRDIICNAIMDKKLMELKYPFGGIKGSGSAGPKGSGKHGGGEGDEHGAAGVRKIEPYIYEMTKRGNPALRCYQLEGPSGSGEGRGWKLFLVDHIKGLTTLDEHFVGAREDYNKTASQSIACAVS